MTIGNADGNLDPAQERIIPEDNAPVATPDGEPIDPKQAEAETVQGNPGVPAEENDPTGGSGNPGPANPQ